MKRLYFLLLLMISIQSFGQVVVTVNADPGVGFPYFTNVANPALTVNANALALGQLIDVNIPVDNNTISRAIPNNTAGIIIDLGSLLMVNNVADLSTAPLSAYFSWSTNPAKTTIYGTLINDLPKNFHSVATFRLVPVATGAAFVNGQWAISGSNPNFELFDVNTNNNSATLSYAVSLAAGPLPVAFKDVRAVKDGCNINMTWEVGNEINVKSYEIVTSKDGGTTWATVGTKVSSHSLSYTNTFALNDQIKGATILVRVKVIDNDGSVHYSDIVSVAGTCGKEATPWVINAYPNPISKGAATTVNAKEGVFSGSYMLRLMDNSGKLISLKQVDLNNVKTFNYLPPASVASGKYNLVVTNKDGSQTTTIQLNVL